MNSKLLAVLLAWRDRVLRAGNPAPPIADLERIAASNRTWPADGLDHVTTAWRPTIQHIETQVRFGVVDPLYHMPNNLWDPPTTLQPSAAHPAQASRPAPVAASRSERPNTSPGPETKAPVPETSQPAVQQPPAPATADSPQAKLSRLRAWVAATSAANPGALASINEPRLQRIAQSTPANRRSMLTGMQLGDWAEQISAVLENRATPAVSSAAEDMPTVTLAPASTPSASAPPPVDDGREDDPRPPDIDPHGFTEYEFGATETEPEVLRVNVTPGKSLNLFWSTPDDGAVVRIFRVVAGDDDEPWSPEHGRLVGVTTDVELEDSGAFTGAVRYLQVWYNSGRTVREAQTNQPVLVAQRRVVAPVQNLSLREETGTVTGEWETFDRIGRVLIYRVPFEKIRQGSQSPVYQILADEDTLNGFRDNAAERGRRYVYQVVAEAHVSDEVLTSVAVSREQQISVVLDRVRDLDVTFDDDGDFFDVYWTAPQAGRVSVYRSEKRPQMGIEDEELSVDALHAAGLTEEDRLSPVRRNARPGQDGMSHVPWPLKWSRSYFTPVTVHNSRVVVGTSVARTRVSPVRDAELVERVDEQLLTFSWPPGAASVQVFQTHRHTPSSVLHDDARPTREVSSDMWRDQGGYHFIPPLARDGCAVHLCAVAFQEGRTYRSAFLTLDYPGLRIVRYATQLKRNKINLVMWTDTPGTMPPVSYALIANAERFPLDIRDGTPVSLSETAEGATTPGGVVKPVWNGQERAEGEWTGELRLPRGRYFIRLFADLPPAHLNRLALLDPPMSDLVVIIR